MEGIINRMRRLVSRSRLFELLILVAVLVAGTLIVRFEFSNQPEVLIESSPTADPINQSDDIQYTLSMRMEQSELDNKLDDVILVPSKLVVSNPSGGIHSNDEICIVRIHFRNLLSDSPVEIDEGTTFSLSQGTCIPASGGSFEWNESTMTIRSVNGAQQISLADNSQLHFRPIVTGNLQEYPFDQYNMQYAVWVEVTQSSSVIPALTRLETIVKMPNWSIEDLSSQNSVEIQSLYEPSNVFVQKVTFERYSSVRLFAYLLSAILCFAIIFVSFLDDNLVAFEAILALMFGLWSLQEFFVPPEIEILTSVHYAVMVLYSVLGFSLVIRIVRYFSRNP